MPDSLPRPVQPPGEHRPARSIVPTGPLHFGLLVEIEAVAAVA